GRTTKIFSKISRGFIADLHPLWWPLLLDAALPAHPEPKMLECCLEMGADVNLRINNKKGLTVWAAILSNVLIDMILRDKEPTRQQEEATLVLWEPSMRLLIGHGASVDKIIVKKAGKLTGKIVSERDREYLNGELVPRLYQSIQRIKNGEGKR
ncbi:uncharacterized protein LY79DRAFT_694908, partial [Colletotrichum navitas]